MKRVGFKRKPGSSFKPPTELRKPLARKTAISAISKKLLDYGTTEATKARIQALLRQIVILRDGGCLLRNMLGIPRCGGYRNDGQLILQAEHLETRGNSASYADSRLVICLCRHHHGHYKPEHTDEYYRIVRALIGPTRSALLTRVQEDRSPHRMYTSDWRMAEYVLERELTVLQSKQ